MTQHEKALIEQWILDNVNETVVPSDEGSAEGLVYNLIHLLRDGKGYRRYNYQPDQDAEIARWRDDGAYFASADGDYFEP